jgi:hypothetical protein
VTISPSGDSVSTYSAPSQGWPVFGIVAFVDLAGGSGAISQITLLESPSMLVEIP